MREWWEGLGTRERFIVIAGSVILIPFLLWVLVWRPLIGNVIQLEQEVASQRENVVWMQNAATELQQLRGSGAQAAAGLGGRSLLAVVDQSARSAGLGSGLKRIEPDTADAVRVRLEGVSFDTLVTWLDLLSRQHGIQASLVSIEREAGPGLVNVRLTLNASS
ncbi:MAG: type II secretion system protein M [Gammaproteobacteria bacterium]|nr:type II secretion system protein M [Gammaproteobacteria bacterium]MBU2478812.1 type II secretion system protein M [Gammaproteobacteria bacterium]